MIQSALALEVELEVVNVSGELPISTACKVGKMRKLPHHVMFQIDRRKLKLSEWTFSVL